MLSISANLHPRAFDCPCDWHNAAAQGAGDAKRTDGRTDGAARLRINEREPAMMLVSVLSDLLLAALSIYFYFIFFSITSLYLSASALAFLSLF